MNERLPKNVSPHDLMPLPQVQFSGGVTPGEQVHIVGVTHFGELEESYGPDMANELAAWEAKQATEPAPQAATDVPTVMEELRASTTYVPAIQPLKE